MPNVEALLYLVVFVIGLITGRITMAVQYSMMKKHSKKEKS